MEEELRLKDQTKGMPVIWHNWLGKKKERRIHGNESSKKFWHQTGKAIEAQTMLAAHLTL